MPAHPEVSPARPLRRPALALRLGQLCLWALILLVPLVFVAAAKDPFRLPKLMLAELLGLASLFFFSFLLWKVARIDPHRRAVFVAVAPLVAVASLTLLTTASRPHTEAAVVGLWIGAACLVGWALALSARRLERCLLLLLVPAALLAILAALQLYDLYQPFELGGDPQGRLTVVSLAGNVGDLGGFLVLPALLAQWGAWGFAGWRRLLLAVTAAVLIFGIAVTQTLAAIGGLVMGSLVLWALLLPRRHLIRGAAAAAVSVAVLLALVEPLRERAGEKARQLARGEVDELLTGRLDGWKTAVWMLRERPLLGVGHGAYIGQFVPAKLALLDRGVGFYPGQPFPVFANAHNELLEVAAEWGLLGLAALGWAVWVLVGRVRLLPAVGEPGGPRTALAWAGLVALLVLALAHFPFRLALTGYPALIFLAWIFRRADEEDEA